MEYSNDNHKDKLTGSGGATLTRRNLLELVGLAFATTAIPPAVMAASATASQDEAPVQGVSPTMDKLSRYMSEAAERPLPDEVVEKAKHHILDTMAAMISGSGIRPGRAALEFVRAYGGKEVATVVSSNIVCGPIEAALANGVLAHSDETDDSHGPSRSHPGVSVVPAALAAGEQFGISGAHFYACGDTRLRRWDASHDEHGRTGLSGCNAPEHAWHSCDFRCRRRCGLRRRS